MRYFLLAIGAYLVYRICKHDIKKPNNTEKIINTDYLNKLNNYREINK